MAYSEPASLKPLKSKSDESDCPYETCIFAVFSFYFTRAEIPKGYRFMMTNEESLEKYDPISSSHTAVVQFIFLISLLLLSETLTHT